MNIICAIKQVPNTAEVKIDPETNTLVRAGVESIVNPFDMVALEAALLIKEKYGGRITTISMGPPQAEEALRETIAQGADEAILLSDRAFAGADTLATSYTLAKAIEKVNQQGPIDLVICGKQAIDGDTAQVGPGIATRLGYTQFTYVVEIGGNSRRKPSNHRQKKSGRRFRDCPGPSSCCAYCRIGLCETKKGCIAAACSVVADQDHNMECRGN